MRNRVVPSNMFKFTFLNSLKNRYFLTTLILLMAVLAGATITHFHVSENRDITTSNISIRNVYIQDTRRIRMAVWDIRDSLSNFLLDPYHDEYYNKLITSVDETLVLTDKFLHQDKFIDENIKQQITLLDANLKKLNDQIQVLIKIRKTPIIQYPALAYARQKLLPYHRQFQTAATLALQEIETDREGNQAQDILLQIKYTWTQMIAEFRMYLSNRLGSFDKGSFDSQIQDIKQWHAEAMRLIKVLDKLDEKGRLSFQTSMGKEDMKAIALKWMEQFITVTEIHATNEWRQDTVFIKNNVGPQFQQIWQNIINIDLALELSANKDLDVLNTDAQSFTRLLWVITFFGIVLVSLGYLILNKVIINPIFSITEALKSEAQGRKHSELPTPNSVETQNLIDAFSEMQKQVRSRQIALEHQALHDGLTGLANRTLLMDRLEHAINQAHRDHSPISLCIIDLDRFKEVNDTLGHHIGDVLLEEVGRRFMNTLRDIDTVARMGGDEFAILLPGDGEEESVFVANKLLETLSNEFVIEGHLLYIGASIGIAIYPQHGTDAKSLIQRADVAMYYAKHNKRGYAIYNPHEDKHSIGRLALVSELNQAIQNNQLELYYQPQVLMENGAVRSVEALLRWNHPGFGWLPPLEIIKLAEENNLINQLTAWIIETAISAHANWRLNGHIIPVTINLSVHNLQDAELLNSISTSIEKHNIDPANIAFEITETAMMLEPSHAVRVLRNIHDMGISLSIDDYGTGYSSLSYLRQVPASELKIDKSFVKSLTDNDDDAIIVRSTIDLAHNLGLSVVAEGVESVDAWEILEILGCDVAQGFYICTPLPANKLINWVKNENKQKMALS